MHSHVKAYEKLVKRQATTSEVKRLETVKNSLGISDDDAIWAIFLGLEYYLSLYKGQQATFDKKGVDLMEQIHKSLNIASNQNDRKEKHHPHPIDRKNLVIILILSSAISSILTFFLTSFF